MRFHRMLIRRRVTWLGPAGLVGPSSPGQTRDLIDLSMRGWHDSCFHHHLSR